MSVSVLQYNVFQRPVFIDNPKEGDFKDERLTVFIEEILNPGKWDVLLLCEVFKGITLTSLCCLRGKRFKKLVEAAVDAGYHCHHGPDAPFCRRFLDGGLVILR